MASRTVISSSHWGAFRASVEGARVTAIQPFERDPFPNELAQGLPAALHGIGGVTGQVTNYSYGAAMVLPPHIVGTMDPVTDLLLQPGGTFEFNGLRETYPEIRLVYWAGGNPFHHHQDLTRLRQAFRRPETVIVHEPWWTATARHAERLAGIADAPPISAPEILKS